MENDVIVTNTESSDELQNGITHADIGEAFVSSFMSEDSDHLEHYGIRGMKWGVRRFQNKDGSLTKAGLKRYGNAVAEAGKKVGKAVGEAARATTNKISEKHAQRKEEKRVEKLMSKPIRKLTEEERIERMDRKTKEKELRMLEKNVKELRESDKSKGRKFVEDMVTKVAIPSVLNAGEKQLTAFLNKKLGDALGLGEKDTNLMRDIIEGNKQLKDLTDGQINKIGKAAESWGNVGKFVFGKNSDQNDDSGDMGTLFKDIMSGKVKTSDLTDGQLNKGKKLAEAADTINKQTQKNQSESKQDDVDSSKLKDKPVGEMTDSELKAYKNRLDTEESVNKVLKQRKADIERGQAWINDDWEP